MRHNFFFFFRAQDSTGEATGTGAVCGVPGPAVVGPPQKPGLGWSLCIIRSVTMADSDHDEEGSAEGFCEEQHSQDDDDGIHLCD